MFVSGFVSLSFSCLSQILCLLSCLSSLVLSCHVLLYCIVLLIFVYFYCKHTFIYFSTGGPMYIFPYFDYMFWYIFPIFSFFCPIWSWKMIQNCGLIFDHSRCHGLMFDYVWVEPGVHFCRCGRGSETAYTFHLMTTFHNTLGEDFYFSFYFILRFPAVFTFWLWFVS